MCFVTKYQDNAAIVETFDYICMILTLKMI